MTATHDDELDTACAARRFPCVNQLPDVTPHGVDFFCLLLDFRFERWLHAFPDEPESCTEAGCNSAAISRSFSPSNFMDGLPRAESLFKRIAHRFWVLNGRAFNRVVEGVDELDLLS